MQTSGYRGYSPKVNIPTGYIPTGKELKIDFFITRSPNKETIGYTMCLG